MVTSGTPKAVPVFGCSFIASIDLINDILANLPPHGASRTIRPGRAIRSILALDRSTRRAAAPAGAAQPPECVHPFPIRARMVTGVPHEGSAFQIGRAHV